MGKYKHTIETDKKEAPETKKIRIEFETWVGGANELLRKILVGDQALMDQAQGRIVARIFAERNHGKSYEDIKWSREITAIAASLTEDQRSEVVRLWERKKAARNRLCEALGGLRENENWSMMSLRVRHPWLTMRQTAGILAHLGLIKQNPGEPVAIKRRTLTEADHDQRAREADMIAAEMVG